MIIETPRHLPLSPRLTGAVINDTQQTADALFQLSTVGDFAPFYGVLESVFRTLNRNFKVASHLRHLSDLQPPFQDSCGGHADRRVLSQALCEIACHAPSVGLIFRDGETRRLLQETIPHTGLDVTDVVQKVSNWENSFSPAERCHTFEACGGDVDAYARALGQVGLTSGNLPPWVLSLGLRSLGERLFGASCMPPDWQSNAQHLVATALEGTVTPQLAGSFAETIRRPSPYRERLLDGLSSEPREDLVDWLRVMAAHAPDSRTLNPAAAWMMGLDFLNIGGALNYYLGKHLADANYGRLLSSAALALLGFAGCHPVVLNPEGLSKLGTHRHEGIHRARGMNHRSQVDIPLLQALDPLGRVVVKKELGATPVLGWPLFGGEGIFQGAQHILVDRQGGEEAHEKLNADVADRFSKGFEITYFPEGTRLAGDDSRSLEVGLQPFKPGVFFAMLAAGLPVEFTPITVWGLGSMLPKSFMDSIGDGLSVGQRLAIDVAEPFIFERPKQGSDMKPAAKAMALEAFNRTWRSLASLQAVMNHLGIF